MKIARCPLTCGELIQGWFLGDNALVSCPIDLEVEAVVKPAAMLEVWPAWRWKAWQAVRNLMDTGLCRPCSIRLNTPQPPSKGFGTSTADIAAALAGAAALSGSQVFPKQLARLAVEVEPTDSTLFEGLCLFAHRTGSFAIALGEPPPLKIAVFDTGGTVDTLEFNAVDRSSQLRQVASEYAAALELLVDGIRSADACKVGEAATISAVLNQDFCPKPGLDQARKLVKQLDGFGVCVAHSGTLIGLLLDVNIDSHALSWLARRFPGSFVGCYRLRGGGVTVADGGGVGNDIGNVGPNV